MKRLFWRLTMMFWTIFCVVILSFALTFYLNYEKKVLHKTVSFDDESNPIEVEIAFQFTEGYQENLISFVNLVRTGDGGTHETGFRSGFTNLMNMLENTVY